MIRVHRLDGSQFVLNAELIETIEATPDTVVRLLNGKVFVIKDTVDQVLSRIVAYKRALFEGFGGPAMGILPSRWTGGETDGAPRPGLADADAELPS
jgi:flagellar protein FlbD